MLALVSQHITNNVVQDAVVAVVGEFGRRVDTAPTRIASCEPSARVRVTGTVAPLKRLQIADINPLFPVNRSVLRVTPCGNSSGKMPIPIRLERWIRSKDSAITTESQQARPSPPSHGWNLSHTPTGNHRQRCALSLVQHRRIVNRHRFRIRQMAGHAPSTGTISLRMRILAKVPRIITSWLPRREP